MGGEVTAGAVRWAYQRLSGILLVKLPQALLPMEDADADAALARYHPRAVTTHQMAAATSSEADNKLDVLSLLEALPAPRPDDTTMDSRATEPAAWVRRCRLTSG